MNFISTSRIIPTWELSVIDSPNIRFIAEETPPIFNLIPHPLFSAILDHMLGQDPGIHI